MQVPDAILWYTEMKKDNINFWVTSFLIPFILSLQILYNVFIINKNFNILIMFFVFFYILYVFVRFKGYSKPLCCNKLTSPLGFKRIKNMGISYIHNNFTIPKMGYG